MREGSFDQGIKLTKTASAPAGRSSGPSCSDRSSTSPSSWSCRCSSCWLRHYLSATISRPSMSADVNSTGSVDILASAKRKIHSRSRSRIVFRSVPVLIPELFQPLQEFEVVLHFTSARCTGRQKVCVWRRVTSECLLDESVHRNGLRR